MLCTCGTVSMQLVEWKKQHLREDTQALVDWQEEQDEQCEHQKGRSSACAVGRTD